MSLCVPWENDIFQFQRKVERGKVLTSETMVDNTQQTSREERVSVKLNTKT